MERFGNLGIKLEAGENRRAEFGPISLDLNTRTLKVDNSPAQENLSPQQYQILWLLVRAQGAIINEQEIMDFLHEDCPDDKDLPLGNGITVQIARLRKKLDSLTKGDVIIENIENRGWFLELKHSA
jgi:two-component system OmpR family response regulator